MSEKYDIEDFTANIGEGCMYEVRERWCTKKRWCVFIMLNPSHIPQKIEKLKVNRTVDKCRSIAEGENNECGGMILLDLYPFPASSGTKLKKIKGNNPKLDAVQKVKHDDCFHNALKNKDALIIIAWGDKSNHYPNCIRHTGNFEAQIEHVKAMIRQYAKSKDENIVKFVNIETKKITHPSWKGANRCSLEKFDYS